MTSLSVVIPVYNGERTVGRAIDSALSQTLRPEEVIVCNDGSTDRTAEILTGYGEAVTVVAKPNGGLSTARNAAVEQATSEYVVLLDADDEWAPDRLESMAKLAPDFDIITSDAWITVGGTPQRTYYEGRRFPDPPDQPVEILRSNFVFVSSAVRRSRLLEIGGFDETVEHQGEYETWVRMILAGSRAALVPEPLAVYHRTVGSLSSDPRPTCRTLLAFFQTLDGLTDAQREAMAEHRVQLRRRLALFDAHQALVNNGEGARRACLRAALAAGVPAPARAKWLAATAFPRVAARSSKLG